VAARQGPGATVETIERIVDRVFASQQTVAVTTDSGMPRCWTSRELVEVEARFLVAITAPPAR
jgi:hypothetical protein